MHHVSNIVAVNGDPLVWRCAWRRRIGSLQQVRVQRDSQLPSHPKIVFASRPFAASEFSSIFLLFFLHSVGIDSAAFLRVLLCRSVHFCSLATASPHIPCATPARSTHHFSSLFSLLRIPTSCERHTWLDLLNHQKLAVRNHGSLELTTRKLPGLPGNILHHGFHRFCPIKKPDYGGWPR
jgi:hypothetical protein